MVIRRLRQIVAPLTIVSLVVLAWATCTDGGVSMAEMACCIEHHDDCDMQSDAAERCCSPDYHARLDVLKPKRSSDTEMPVAIGRAASGVLTIAAAILETSHPAFSPAASPMGSLASHYPRFTVLRI